MFALQGFVDLSKNTTKTDISKLLVKESFEQAKELNKNNFGCFYDSFLALLKMLGQSEYDKYKDEIIGQVLNDITQFGTDIDIQNNVLNNVVNQLGIDFDKVNELKIKQEAKVKQVFTSNKLKK